MATIIFSMLPEAGHVNASFKVAKALSARGHRVLYSEPRYFERYVNKQGFEMIPLLDDFFPNDFTLEQASTVSWFEVLKSALKLDTKAGKNNAANVLLRELDLLVEKQRPDLLLIDGLLSEMATAAHTLAIPTLLINTALYDPFDDHGIIEDAPVFASTLYKLPALFLCPQEFDFPRQRGRQQHYYVEASIDTERREVDFPWARIRDDKKLIYCSLGTQSFLYAESKQVLQVFIDTFAQRTDSQLVLSIGSHLRVEHFRDVPDNVILVPSAPQLELLKRCTLMITHGGLNTIKECVFFGVPMIVFPVKRDQPRNAARVAYHGLGVMGNIQHISVDQVRLLVDKVEKNASFKAKAEAMSKIFREMENSGQAVKVIESFLGKDSVVESAST